MPIADGYSRLAIAGCVCNSPRWRCARRAGWFLNWLPVAIAKSIKAKYPQGKIEDVDWINTGGKITYKVDIEGTPDVNVWYSADGKFIKELAD